MSDNPFVKPVTDFTFIDPKPHSNGNWQIVVLERIVAGEVPDYCIHGRVQCHRCELWCYLGDRTHELVKAGETVPMCVECATEIGVHLHGAPKANVGDHRRADGPH